VTRRRHKEGASAALAAFVTRSDAGGATAIVAAPTSFEIVNAAFGRDAGDRLIQAMAARIAEALHDAPSLVERDGATFTIVVAGPGGGGDSAVAAIEQALGQPFAVGDRTIHIGARLGVARMSEREPPDHLLRRAGGALARAQAGDGARTQIAGAGEGVPLAALAADLHRAIERDEIDVVFQPQVALRGGAIVGVEALARWRHPRRGPLGAHTLLEAAERADLGVALSDHIQRLALERAAAWPAALARLRIAVNVTAADIARAGFAPQFLARIAAAGLSPARVTAEVTEGGLIHDMGGAAIALGVLREAGCRVALDDFGTGYSSLSYLTRLPLDYLKIDRSLTQAIVGDARQRTVVEGVIAIAAGLELETIAEGVETEEQRRLLADRGCTYYQGFLCSGPVDGDALAGLMATWGK
jgi:EAL domain-containing protein (putative c-di-GMP-specific phosphodiesterase class I)/GGDEF domain-containing protein